MQAITSVDKVANGKATLLRKQPFFGVPSFKLKWEQRDDIPTACTDGKSILWSGTFFDGLTKSEAIGVILHEIFHVILKHPLEMKRFLKANPQYNTQEFIEKINMAMDYSINPKIKAINEDWITLPKDCLFDDKYIGKHWTEIFFDLIKDDQNNQSEDEQGDQQGNEQGDEQGDEQGNQQGGNDSQSSDQSSDQPTQSPSNQPSDVKSGGMGGVMCPTNDDGSEMSQSEADQMEKELDILIEQALNIAKSKGDLASDLVELAENNKKAKVNWETILRKFIAPIKAKFLTYEKFNKRQQASGSLLPIARKSGTAELSLAIDTSSSTYMHEIEQCIAEVQKIVDKVKPEKVTIHWFTSTVWRSDQFKTGQKLVIPTKLERGGTNFQAVFDKVNNQNKKPKALIVLTDMECSFPKKPSYPVLWVSTQPNQTAPFGTVTHLDAVA